MEQEVLDRVGTLKGKMFSVQLHQDELLYHIGVNNTTFARVQKGIASKEKTNEVLSKAESYVNELWEARHEQ
ncbi:hypothetical protein [Weissella paramesenteroides]|uniref:XRE family transcriptional regulator n=1 Tax=Weissella paramesenteroides ATCC 33313 TaxID=585506 RepID=C5R836_WEIPA|nr:hypothetical protein [Weissella paramesenteroides]EER75620.1 hypothetical protein HMPREF0877_0131 [Weissella paramesenteroides ATCC 33313]